MLNDKKAKIEAAKAAAAAEAKESFPQLPNNNVFDDDDDEDDVELVQYVPGTEPFSMTVDLDKEEAIDVDYEKLASMKWLSEMQVVEKPKKKRRTKLVKPKAKWRVLGVIGELEKKKKQN